MLVNGTLLRRTSVLAVAAVATLALASCGNDNPSEAQDPAAAPTTSIPPTTSAPAEPTQTATATPSETPSSAAASADTLITLEAPADHATVSGSFDAKGTANSPEANVPWQILDLSGKKVVDGYFTAEGWMDKLYPYAGTVDVSKLAPGAYTFEVSVDDPSGGEGKPPQKVDRAITVQ
ncbi:hypothetical protein JCM18899A_36600 [Nocardioides sp. AN3]